MGLVANTKIEQNHNIKDAFGDQNLIFCLKMSRRPISVEIYGSRICCDYTCMLDKNVLAYSRKFFQINPIYSGRINL